PAPYLDSAASVSAAALVVLVRVRLVGAVVFIAVVAVAARQLSLQSLKVRSRRAVLELTRHLRLLGLSPAAPHGSTPSHAGTKPSGGSAASFARQHPLVTTVQGSA